MQLTEWNQYNRANNHTFNGLMDYANKNWAGLVKDFYLPR